MTAVYRLTLREDQRVYRLEGPRQPGRTRIVLRGAHPPPLAKLALISPLPAGRYELMVESHLDDRDRTIVLSLPVAGGSYFFVVSASGRARYDIVLEGAAGAEYRAAFVAPRIRHQFQATFTSPP